MPRSMIAPVPPGSPMITAAGVQGTSGPTWVLPAGWVELPAQPTRFATFQIDATDPKLNVIVYTFGPESGAVLPNVNRWEQQIGASLTQAADLAKVVTHIAMNGLELDEVDLKAPPAAGQSEGSRMLAAIIPAQGQMWFLKFVGPASKVEAHQAEYDAFLHSLSFAATAPTMPAGHPADQVAAGKAPPTVITGAHPGASTIPAFAAYTKPQGWVLDPQERPMRVATFHVTGDGEQADVIISALPANQFGTPEANINRWRGQVGLAPVDDPASVARSEMAIGGAKGFQLDFAGLPAAGQPAQRLIVAQVTKGATSYFFKFIGPGKLVEQQKQSFDSFLQSIQFAAE